MVDDNAAADAYEAIALASIGSQHLFKSAYSYSEPNLALVDVVHAAIIAIGLDGSYYWLKGNQIAAFAVQFRF